MDRYLISLTHTTEDCVRALKAVEGVGMITHFDWGCKDGEHTGWVTIEAENKAQAMMVVPPLLRDKAHAVMLVKFSPQDVQSMHVM
ncbi:MAG TPA: hypothetical protein VI215_04635 [Bacteroidota bacterium]|jgi:hypothetical protein